jgi:hypothetical protein
MWVGKESMTEDWNAQKRSKMYAACRYFQPLWFNSLIDDLFCIMLRISVIRQKKTLS